LSKNQQENLVNFSIYRE